jgi:hypothetical protein
MSNELLVQAPGETRQSVSHGKKVEASGTPDGRVMTAADAFDGGEMIIPSDATAVTAPHRALWIGVAGTLAGEMKKKDGTTSTFATSVQCGVFPFVVTKIKSTGTTATGIIAGW